MKVKVDLLQKLLVFFLKNLLVFWIGITIYNNTKDQAYQLALAGNGKSNLIIFKNKKSVNQECRTGSFNIIDYLYCRLKKKVCYI